MRTLAANRRESRVDCEEIGDFCWLVTVRNSEGRVVDMAPKGDERPTHIYLIDPEGNRTRLPIKPTANGWDWDGDLDRPSIKPSIRTHGGRTWNGWHGWLGKGVMTDA